MSDAPEVRIAVVESRLDNHEKICGERYSEISKGFDSVSGKLDKIMWAAWAMVVAILAYVVVNGRPWENVG